MTYSFTYTVNYPDNTDYAGERNRLSREELIIRLDEIIYNNENDASSIMFCIVPRPGDKL